MEDAEEVTAATADQSKRRFKVALTRYLSYTGRCSKGMRRHGGSTEETTEAVEDATAATADSATTRAKGASIRPLDGVFTTTERGQGGYKQMQPCLRRLWPKLKCDGTYALFVTAVFLRLHVF